MDIEARELAIRFMRLPWTRQAHLVESLGVETAHKPLDMLKNVVAADKVNELREAVGDE